MQPIAPNDPQLAGMLVALAEKAASMNAADREQAEREIKGYQNVVDQQVGFVQLLLNLATSGLPTSTFFSIVLKNTVKLCWNPSTSEHCIQEVDKAAVRGDIIRLMVHSPPGIQRNMAETIAIIAEVDFPLQWPNALSLIVAVLDADHAVQCAALSTAHSILLKYRRQGEMTETFVAELRTIYTVLFPSLLRSMGSLLATALAQQPGTDVVTCLKGVTAAVECLRDMTSLDLGDEFIEQKKTIVDMFLACLGIESGASVDGEVSQHSSAVIALKSAVTACVTHLLSLFDEDFEAFAPQFLAVVLALVANPASRAAEMDDLVICSIELLSGACRGTNRPYFNDPGRLRALMHDIILPNLAVDEDDLELYEHDPDAYIQKDIEGSDFHTRRRAAGDLVRALVVALPDTMRPLLSAETENLFAASATNWQAKDTAIYLASSLALEGQHVDTQRGAAAQQLSNLIPFDHFLNTIVIPELASGLSANSPAIIKSDCVRVIALFRNHIAPSLYPDLIPVLGKWMDTEDQVLMSYAAHALERLLSVQRGQQYVATEDMFQPHTIIILQTLCQLIHSMIYPNQYLMQCLMRVSFRFPHAIAPYTGAVVECLNVILHNAARNPSNPLFSHCLFECISKCVAIQPPAQADAIEDLLWDNLIYILAQDVTEYVPYALQILAQLLRTHQPPGTAPPERYQALLGPLTQTGLYEHRGNVPAVVCLLCAFIDLYPGYVNAQNLTNPILNIFSFLVRLKNYDHEGLNIVTSMLLAYPPQVMNVYIDNVLLVLFDRLAKARTPKFVRILILFLSVFVVVRSADDLVARMNTLQPGLFMMLLGRVWLGNMHKITGALERKTCVVALAKVLCDCAELQSDQAAWTSSVFSCLKMIHAGAEDDDYTSFSPKAGTLQDLAKMQGAPTDVEFTNVFCPLQEAVPKPKDVCADVPDADRYFRERMMELLRGRGSHLVGPLQATLTPDLLALIQ